MYGVVIHGEEMTGNVKAGLLLPKPSPDIYFLEGCLALKMGRMKKVTGNSNKYFPC